MRGGSHKVGFSVLSLGVGFRHPSGFTIDRPKGLPEHVFCLFLVPVRIHDVTGMQRAEAHSCILYGPGFRQWYTGDGVGLDNHWFHAHGKDFDRMIRKYGIPVNRVMRPARTDFVAPILSEIRDELSLHDTHTEHSAGLLMERLLLLLWRALREPDQAKAAFSARKRELLEACRRLRVQIYEQPQEAWSVGEMARRVHLSASRFTPVYREFFGTSPHEDVLSARLERAKWLLSSTTEKVASVAEQSGFANIYHFSRLFRKKVGCPPTAYARR